MPCRNHHHQPWPLSGRHRLRIEACETQCGWCEYSTDRANNLRVHAHRHLKNPKEVSLRQIELVPGRAGRSRVASRSEEPHVLRASSDTFTSPSPPSGRLLHSVPAASAHESETDRIRRLEYHEKVLSERIHQLTGLLRRHGIDPDTIGTLEPSTPSRPLPDPREAHNVPNIVRLESSLNQRRSPQVRTPKQGEQRGFSPPTRDTTETYSSWFPI